ncbi:hypothetical protein [Pseudoduganella aquatica]|uniref:hypothetical protein n=1 Tax=Pseudoduganella aquatica TaxID=2660641 RepID=UPI001E543655|nr:hypothetical protein [Pseudoduganella aquatica]
MAARAQEPLIKQLLNFPGHAHCLIHKLLIGWSIAFNQLSSMPRPFLSLCVQLCAACVLSSAAAANLDGLAKRSWIKVDSPNFSIVTDQPEAVALRVVTDMEAFRHFRREYGTLKALELSKPLPILALGEDAFAEIGFPATWAGVFQLDLQGYSAVANIGDYMRGSKTDNWPRTVLLHEYFHFLLRMSERTFAYPHWVDEGMADYWATFNVNGPTIRLGDRVTSDGGSRDHGLYNHLGRLSLDMQTTFNTVDLTLEGSSRADHYDLSRFYSAAYFAVHYFNSTDALRASLARYVTFINRGYRQDRAAALAFQQSYAELNKAIAKYASLHLTAQVMTYRHGDFVFPKISPSVTRLDTPGLYAQLARILPNHKISRADLEKLLTRNRELNQDDADANLLPLLHGLESSTAGAALEQRFPKHPMLLTLRADMLRGQAEHMKDQGEAGWPAIAYKARDYYRKAIRIDAGYPAPYNGLGLLYQLLPASEPLQEAVAGFDTASIYTREPETFRQLAGVFLRMGKPMEALDALRSAVAFSKPSLLGPEALLLDNVELLNDLAGEAKATATGLEYAGGTRYTGAVSNGKPDGMGKISLPNGSYYEGPFVQGVPHGKGKLASDSGLVYLGEFDRGYGRGQGEVSYPSGSEAISYKGQVDYMRPSGKGELVTKTGRYMGGFEDGNMHGAGEFTAAKKPVTLSGAWRRGGFEWAATDGIVFNGPADANGLRHGKGTCRGTDASDIPTPCVFKEGKLLFAAD